MRAPSRPCGPPPPRPMPGRRGRRAGAVAASHSRRRRRLPTRRRRTEEARRRRRGGDGGEGGEADVEQQQQQQQQQRPPLLRAFPASTLLHSADAIAFTGLSEWRDRRRERERESAWQSRTERGHVPRCDCELSSKRPGELVFFVSFRQCPPLFFLFFEKEGRLFFFFFFVALLSALVDPTNVRRSTALQAASMPRPGKEKERETFDLVPLVFSSGN